MRGRLFIAVTFALAGACSAAPGDSDWTEASLLVEGTRFLDDDAYRRATVLRSYENPDNEYSHQRIESYALGDRGWDRLPEWNPVVDGRALWNGVRPTTLDGWVALGREVFFRYPMRPDALAEFAADRSDVADAVGVLRDGDGNHPGIVAFVDVEGNARRGITCALCHSNVENGAIVAGRARRAFDYGRLRITYHATTGVPVDEELVRRMARWGPGRADVTNEDEDPVAIPDLWGLKSQSSLTQAGTIRNFGPAALAIRQETQLIETNHLRTRPPRALAWALAMYLYSLNPPVADRPPPSVLSEVGARIFDRQCLRCHANEAGGGALIPVERVGTDPGLALGVARGTGSYRPPALLDVRHAAPYLHHGAVSSLEELLSPARFDAAYAKSPVGPGPVPGHAFGTDLPQPDRAALIAYLNTL